MGNKDILQVLFVLLLSIIINNTVNSKVVVPRNSITQEILDALNDYDLIIADLTGHNPNVFFEIGYRTKSQKPIIHLKRKDETIPFDVSIMHTFEYDLTDLDMVTATKKQIRTSNKKL